MRPPPHYRSQRVYITSTLADAICDPLAHGAHVLALQAPSMREQKGTQTAKPTSSR